MAPIVRVGPPMASASLSWRDGEQISLVAADAEYFGQRRLSRTLQDLKRWLEFRLAGGRRQPQPARGRGLAAVL